MTVVDEYTWKDCFLCGTFFPTRSKVPETGEPAELALCPECIRNAAAITESMRRDLAE